jgi:putative ABC transport system permease protein
MRFTDKLPRGIRRLFRLPQSYARRMRDLDEEIRFHFDALVARLRAGGMSDAEAEAAALKRFGDTDDLRSYCGAIAARREPGRRLWRWVDEFGQDVHSALRQIARAPMFAATATLILALGIGANTGVFSIVNHLLISPFPFADGNRMVVIMSTSGGGRIGITPNADLIEAWRTRARAVQDIVVFEEASFTLGDSTRGQTQTLFGAAVPPDMMSFIGMKPLRGRWILASDTLADAPPVAVIGAGLWQREFGGAPDIVGRKVVLNGETHTVVGVMPEEFFIPFADVRDVFVATSHAKLGRPDGIGKLATGMTIKDANREIAALFPPKSALNVYADPPRISREIDMVGHDRKQMILLLFGAVGIVLLIACANVANLLLARSWGRQREFAVRIALGAGRWRIVRQVLTESGLLAAIGGAMGIGFAYLVLRGVRAALPAGGTDFKDVHIEQAVLLWSVAISAATGVLFGVGPAFAASGASASETLKASSRTATGGRLSRRIRIGLVVGEVALSVVLLAGAGLLVRTLIALDRIDVGFVSPGLSSMRVSLPNTTVSDSNARRAAWIALRSGVEAIPGVRGATLAMAAPADFAISMGGLEVEGHPAGPGDSLSTFAMNTVSPEYFSLTGIPLKQGRGFTPSSGPSTSVNEDEIIVNEALARRLWPTRNALGARVRRGYVRGVWSTVVGIVGDVRLPSQQTDRLNRDLQLYLRSPSAPAYTTLLVRANVPLGTLGPAITKAIHEVNPAFKITSSLKSSDEMIASGMDTQRFVLRLIGAFALFAVVMAAVGLHGVIAYSVNQRTREIGLRVALGADARDVTRLVLRQGLRLAVAGVVVGVGVAIAATRVLRVLLYGVQPGDPVTLGLVGVLLLGIAVVATYAPARRAARLDPAEALRAD